jgi:hypothetical protein
MGVIDPEFKNNVQRNLRGPVNFIWALFIAAVMFGLAAKFLWSGYPPAISFLEPWFELVGIVVLLGGAFLIADKHPLVKG